MIFWFIYFFTSIAISFSISALFKYRLNKYLFFFISLGIINAVWFKVPGSNEIAPIISILILENTILEAHSFYRLLRPLSLFIFLVLVIAMIFWLRRPKN